MTFLCVCHVDVFDPTRVSIIESASAQQAVDNFRAQGVCPVFVVVSLASSWLARRVPMCLDCVLIGPCEQDQSSLVQLAQDSDLEYRILTSVARKPLAMLTTAGVCPSC